MTKRPEGLSPEDEDAIFACTSLVARSGAVGVEIGFLYADVPIEKADWYAVAKYRGAKIMSEHHTSPSRAAEGLARRVLNGGRCMHCKGAVTLSGKPGKGVCAWWRNGRVWVRGCE